MPRRRQGKRQAESEAALRELEALAGKGFGFLPPSSRKARMLWRASKPLRKRGRAEAELNAREETRCARAARGVPVTIPSYVPPEAHERYRALVELMRRNEAGRLAELVGRLTEESLTKRLQKRRREVGKPNPRGRPRKPRKK